MDAEAWIVLLSAVVAALTWQGFVLSRRVHRLEQETGLRRRQETPDFR